MLYVANNNRIDKLTWYSVA